MAISKIKTVIKIKNGTLTSQTGDYYIDDFLAKNEVPLQAYCISNSGYRPINVGKASNKTSLIVIGIQDWMANLPFVVYVYG